MKGEFDRGWKRLKWRRESGNALTGSGCNGVVRSDHVWTVGQKWGLAVKAKNGLNVNVVVIEMEMNGSGRLGDILTG